MRNIQALMTSMLIAALLFIGATGSAQADMRTSCCTGFIRSDGARPGQYFFDLGESEFRRSHYTEAVERFRLAAFWGHKTAQYNLGLMYFKGVGVPEDRPAGMAWLTLAAERDEVPFVNAREWAYAQLTPEQFDQANRIWRKLKADYADSRALVRANKRWKLVASQATGSHLGGFAGSNVIAQTIAGEADLTRRFARIRAQSGPYENLAYPRVEVGHVLSIEAKATKAADAGSEPATR